MRSTAGASGGATAAACAPLAIRACRRFPAADWELLIRVARRTRLLARIEADLAGAGLLDGIPMQAANHLRAARNVVAASPDPRGLGGQPRAVGAARRWTCRS